VDPVFDFGLNWESFSRKAVTGSTLETAATSLRRTFLLENFNGESFLDVGCGSGIFSVAAKKLDAGRVVGLDLSIHSIEAARHNAQRFERRSIEFLKADILDATLYDRLGMFDNVCAWGSLHHTGSMWEAFKNTARFVKPGGRFVLAIYRKHFSSRMWRSIKRFYNRAPRIMKRIMEGSLYPTAYLGVALWTRKNPIKILRGYRGMDFHHDVVDWLGGYPYEYAAAEDICRFAEGLGFETLKVLPAIHPLGNNEFLFTKKK